MRKIYIAILSLFVISSCTDDMTSINDDQKRATNVPAPMLVSNAQKNLADIMTTPSVNSNIFRLLSQYWAETTYTDESRYDLNTRNIPQNFWNVLYRDVLRDLKTARELVEADDSFVSADEKANQIATISIIETYVWFTLVNTYGDIPYTEALDAEVLQPKYDDASAIYDALIDNLNAALSSINVAAPGIGGADLIYGGEMTNWRKFGNSLKLKMGIMLADVNPTKASELILAAAPNAFSSNADNAVFNYLSAPPNTNPIWVNLVQSGRNDFVVANTLVDHMAALSDPRLALYFTVDAEGGYTGGTYGTSNNFATYSKPSDDIQAPSFEALLFDYSEVEFILAEAVERGIAVGGTAESHYNNGISASIEYWGGSAADASTYLALPEVAYTTAAGTYKEKIGLQKWIALYNRGHEAWTEYRRLDAPLFNVVPDPIADFPVRYTYPVSEQNLNTDNYTSAASAVGGDKVSTKLFWDTF